jgi:hypothetical protein
MISHSVANGNQDLEPALEMCNDLKRDLDLFTLETQAALKSKSDPVALVSKLKRLLTQVDDTVPSLYLSLRSIDSSSDKISSSKLVQASNLLQQQQNPSSSFTVTLYSLFAANIRPPSTLAPSSFECTWKEEARKCHLTIEKQKQQSSPSSPPSIGYELVLKEDTDDGLYHDKDDKPKEWHWQVDHIKRMFYTKSGKLLNIEDARASVLVLKLLKKDLDGGDETSSSSPQPVMKAKEATPDIQRSELQVADWFAVEIWNDSSDDDDDDSEDDDGEDNDTEATNKKQSKTKQDDTKDAIGSDLTEPMLPMNLLLLESVIKLALLEVTEQMNHLNASDELLNMYMA